MLLVYSRPCDQKKLDLWGQEIWACVWGKLCQGNHVIIVTTSVSKSFVLKMLSIHTKAQRRLDPGQQIRNMKVKSHTEVADFFYSTWHAQSMLVLGELQASFVTLMSFQSLKYCPLNQEDGCLNIVKTDPTRPNQRAEGDPFHILGGVKWFLNTSGSGLWLTLETYGRLEKVAQRQPFPSLLVCVAWRFKAFYEREWSGEGFSVVSHRLLVAVGFVIAVSPLS